VVINTMGHGRIPMLMTASPTWMSFPPMSSATIALVINIPASITYTMSFLDLNMIKISKRKGLYSLFCKKKPRVSKETRFFSGRID
jgi:hypothetical protein